LTLCCQLSNYRDANGDGEDIVGDLKKESLVEALDKLVGLVSKVHRERLAMAGDPEQRDKLHYPCLVCIERFKKTGEQPMLIQVQGKVSIAR
jgi:hypothetical protein